MTKASCLILLLTSLPGVLGQTPAHLPHFKRQTPAVLAVQNEGPAVVSIKTQSRVRARHLFGDLFQPGLQNRSLGSGVIVHPDGYLITNEHVVAGAEKVTVTLKNGRTFPARIINKTVGSDIAVLKIEGQGPFPCAVLGTSSDLMVGETVFALGNPFGLRNSMTSGVLSAVGRTVPFRGRPIYRDFLQTSALINPGNSGGPLLNINGRVIGINVAIDTRGQGIGYAIPIDRVKAVMTSLVNPEVVQNSSLGLQVQALRDNLVVAGIDSQGPAARAGLKPKDIILNVNGKPVHSRFAFYVALLSKPEDQPARLEVQRLRQRLDIRVTPENLDLTPLAVGMQVADLKPSLNLRLGLPRNLKAVLVTGVRSDGPAHKVGLKPGDLILEVGGYDVSSVKTLNQILALLSSRQATASVVIYRNGRRYDGVMAF